MKIYRRTCERDLVITIPTGDLPHGIWGSGDGSRVYVGLENEDAVIAIDTHTNSVIATIPIGQQPQALVYVRAKRRRHGESCPTGQIRRSRAPVNGPATRKSKRCRRHRVGE